MFEIIYFWPADKKSQKLKLQPKSKVEGRRLRIHFRDKGHLLAHSFIWRQYSSFFLLFWWKGFAQYAGSSFRHFTVWTDVLFQCLHGILQRRKCILRVVQERNRFTDAICTGNFIVFLVVDIRQCEHFCLLLSLVLEDNSFCWCDLLVTKAIVFQMLLVGKMRYVRCLLMFIDVLIYGKCAHGW